MSDYRNKWVQLVERTRPWHRVAPGGVACATPDYGGVLVGTSTADKPPWPGPCQECVRAASSHSRPEEPA